ncbi:MAG: hypothetical protein ABI639_10505 [Thermoanaerobaculia bacterium]
MTRRLRSARTISLLPAGLFFTAALWSIAVGATGPVVFAPGVISTGMDDAHATFSADGKTLYFIRSTPDFSHWTILISHLGTKGWETPVVAPWSGRWADGDVFLTADQARLYFISNRPVTGDAARPDTEIWTMQRKDKSGDSWEAPQHVAELSGPGDEWFPTLTTSGTVYFGSERPGGQGACDLWRARREGDHFAAPENLGPTVNSADQEIEPYVSPDESFLIFAGKGRPGNLGSYDLYLTYNCAGQWSAPVGLGAGVNSAGWDFGPRISPDGKSFYFTSNRSTFVAQLTTPLGYDELMRRLSSPQNGLRDIYRLDTAELALRSPCAAARNVN